MPAHKDSPEVRQAFAELYAVNLGQMLKTCRDLSLDRKSIGDWRKQYPDFDHQLSEIEQNLNEMVEHSLIELALNEEKPNIVAKIFFLKNNWKEKYGERPIENPGQALLWFDPKTSTVSLPAPVEAVEEQ